VACLGFAAPCAVCVYTLKMDWCAHCKRGSYRFIRQWHSRRGLATCHGGALSLWAIISDVCIWRASVRPIRVSEYSGENRMWTYRIEAATLYSLDISIICTVTVCANVCVCVFDYRTVAAWRVRLVFTCSVSNRNI
jgi:hypothetical protein